MYIIEMSTTDPTELLQSKFKYIYFLISKNVTKFVQTHPSVSCNNLIGRALLIPSARITNEWAGTCCCEKKEKN